MRYIISALGSPLLDNWRQPCKNPLKKGIIGSYRSSYRRQCASPMTRLVRSLHQSLRIRPSLPFLRIVKLPLMKRGIGRKMWIDKCRHKGGTEEAIFELKTVEMLLLPFANKWFLFSFFYILFLKIYQGELLRLI